MEVLATVKAEERKNTMTTRLVGFIDRWLAVPLSLTLRWLACGVTAVRGRRSIPARGQTICLAKFARLGSIINTIPTLQAVRERYPSAHIVYVTFARHRELVRRLSYIDEGLFIDEHSALTLVYSFYVATRRLRQLSPSFYLDLQCYTLTYFSALVATLSGASRTIGFFRQSSLAKKRLLDNAIYFNAFQPLQTGFEQVAAVIGCELRASSKTDNYCLTTLARDREELERYLDPEDTMATPLLVINPNASAACLERRWPRERFAETAYALLRRIPDLRIMLIGTAEERGYVEGLRFAIDSNHERVLNLAGMLSVGGLLALLKRASCLLTNDSGPMHLAFALGIPTVALFGPVNPQDHVSQANQQKTVIFYQPVSCSPCMQRIPVASVRDACLALLTATPLRGGLAAQWKPAPRTTPMPDRDRIATRFPPGSYAAIGRSGRLSDKETTTYFLQ